MNRTHLTDAGYDAMASHDGIPRTTLATYLDRAGHTCRLVFVDTYQAVPGAGYVKTHTVRAHCYVVRDDYPDTPTRQVGPVAALRLIAKARQQKMANQAAKARQATSTRVDAGNAKTGRQRPRTRPVKQVPWARAAKYTSRAVYLRRESTGELLRVKMPGGIRRMAGGKLKVDLVDVGQVIVDRGRTFWVHTTKGQ